jgi:hypothetical protein
VDRCKNIYVSRSLLQINEMHSFHVPSSLIRYGSFLYHDVVVFPAGCLVTLSWKFREMADLKYAVELIHCILVTKNESCNGTDM